jgi:hypothetical protein
VTAQPIGPRSGGSSADWYPGAGACSRVYLLACVRALIALALLAVVAIIVLF